jgi:S-DNA-T family DNA segregation ATPase FtsK/SpoIIIE
MRLLITAESPRSGASRDLVCEYSAETTIRDLARTVAGQIGERAPAVDRSNVVDLRTRETSVEPEVDLFLGEVPLDPGATIDASEIRQGATIGVGGPSSHRDREPVGLVEVRVESGRGAGHVHRLGAGTATIGSAAHCTVRIEDDAVPDVAATLEIDMAGAVTITPDAATTGATLAQPHRREPADEPIILAASSVRDAERGRLARLFRRKPVSTDLELGDRVDPLADLPLLRLDRQPVDETVSWEPGQDLGVGNVLLEQVAPGNPDASLSPSPSRPELDYNRPPRLHPAEKPREFTLPQEPRKPDKMPFPLVMMLSPLVMSGSMYFITRSPYTLMIMVMMPVMMLMNSTTGRRQQKRRYLAQVDEYNEKRVGVERAAVDSLIDERFHRRTVFPDPASTLLFATGPRARLWERRRWDADFLVLRVGTCDLPSQVEVRDPDRAAHEGPLRWTAPDVPVTVDLGDAGVVGVAGDETRRRVGSWLVAQVATLHSPADTSVWVLTDPDGEDAWDWVKWLPHARGDEGSRAVRIGADDDGRSQLVGELSSIVSSRRELDEKAVAAVQRVVVVLDGARELRLLPGMISVLKDGPGLGVHVLCLDRTVHELPEECRSVISFADDLISLETTAERHVDGVRPDLVERSWLERLARALSPIRDVSTEDPSAALPSSSRLLDVLGLPHPDGATLAERWARSGRSTRATIGEGLDGPFTIDVRADGPHGLVAGTTGSGKSELLQTIIASLAVGNRPDEFTFVLVDYKGGAAFMDCQRLPHTVGMVTDLDGHLTTRALESLQAELHHREHQLAAAQAKDIEDYLAGRKPGDEPMPRLLIIIDEFAALVAELPDFVTGLVDVARRGRSLGVHLILATQRPAGVVNAEIKSNTNLRIALRVTDKGDSDDVIESGVAADIAKSTPGRAYARLGASSLQPFQSSRVGGRPRGAADDDLVASSFGWSDLSVAGRRVATATVEDDVEVPTDLATLVAAVREANEQIGLGPMRKPWLPPLPEAIGLDALDSPEPQDGVVPPVPLGLADIPYRQQQQVETWDIERGSHLMIAGQSRSGRSSALRLVAAAIARQTSPADVHLFGIDAGNNALLPLVALPHVGAVVTRLQVDRMTRLFDHLQREVSTRQQSLAEQGYADIREQRSAAAPEDRLPYLVVLLDRLEGFTTAFESVDGGVLLERLNSLLQEGAGAGLRLVIGSDRSGVLGRISMLVEDRVVLSMSDPSDFSAVGMTARQVPITMPPGRAFRAGERARELQWALLDASGVGTDQVRVLQEIGREAAERWAEVPKQRRPQRVDELPAAITLAEALELDPVSDSPTFTGIGVGGDTLALQGFDPMATGAGFLVAGPPRSGRSNVLQVIIERHLQMRREVLVIAPRVSPLRDLADRRLTVLTGAEPIEEIKERLGSLRRGHTIVVDDFEVLGADSPVAGALADAYGAMRDTANAMVVAGSLDEISSVYRGLTVEMKRGRSGLILAPRAASDGDVLNVRLPRSVGSAVPQGRGVMTSPTGWRWVQVPRA